MLRDVIVYNVCSWFNFTAVKIQPGRLFPILAFSYERKPKSYAIYEDIQCV